MYKGSHFKGPFIEEETPAKAYDAKIMKRIWGFTRPYKSIVYISFITFPLLTSLQLLQPYLIKVAIDESIMKYNYRILPWIVLIFITAMIAEFVVRYIQVYTMSLAGQKVMHDLRMAIFSHIEYMHTGFFEKNPIGRLITRVISDVQAINEMFSSGIVSIFGDIVTLVGIILIMLIMNAKLALAAFSLMPLLALLAIFFRNRARKAYREIRMRIARLNSFLQESIAGMPIIQVFVREKEKLDDFKQINKEYRQALNKAMHYDAFLFSLVDVFGSIAIAVLLWYGGGQIIKDMVTFGVLIAFIEYTQKFFVPIRDLSAKYSIMQSAMASSERIFELLDTKAEINDPFLPVLIKKPEGEIEFRNVSFGYNDGEDVLRNISFSIKSGEKVAFVGLTGSGKSTLIKLLTRSYDPKDGVIYLDGVNIRDMKLSDLRKNIGVVLQDVYLFSGDVISNIRLGEESITDEHIRQAARVANVNHFIEKFKDGYYEQILERGSNLSTGEKQLLALARIVAFNPVIIVLDEPTSSIDSHTEALIQEALGRVMTDRTSIIIAHRLSTIRNVDRIIVIHKGVIRESGTHNELLQCKGIYWRLYHMQNTLLKH